jgi:hypothetical protein
MVELFLNFTLAKQALYHVSYSTRQGLTFVSITMRERKCRLFQQMSTPSIHPGWAWGHLSLFLKPLFIPHFLSTCHILLHPQAGVQASHCLPGSPPAPETPLIHFRGDDPAKLLPELFKVVSSRFEAPSRIPGLLTYPSCDPSVPSVDKTQQHWQV